MTDRITPHFIREEFACKGKTCGCHGNTVDVNLAKALNLLRLHFNQPVKITSGFRCKKHNKAISGSKNSQHMKGKAADFKVKNTSPRKVYLYLTDMYPDKYGIGQYKTFVHLDVRENKARWRD